MNSVFDFLSSLYSSDEGLWKFSPGCPASLLATGHAVLAMEHANELERLSETQKSDVCAAIQERQRDDGTFEEPLLDNAEGLSHGLDYAREEVTTFCQQVLHALGSKTVVPRSWHDKRHSPEGISSYFASLPWNNPWRDSNFVMYLLSQLVHDYEIHGMTQYRDSIEEAMNWLDSNQDPDTGMWHRKQRNCVRNTMAAWFHYTFYYQYFDREMKHLDRIVDTCLKLQNSKGLFDFGTGAIGQNCLDYDAVDLLVLASRNRDYRKQDVTRCLNRFVKSVQPLQNTDGGWCGSKQTRKPWFGTRIAKRLPDFLRDATTSIVEADGRYSVCASFMVAPAKESNPFCSWFRPLAVSIAKLYLDGTAGNCKFRSLPFLGYHKGF